MEISSGQRLALEQLKEISVLSNGDLEILGEPKAGANGNYIVVRFSLRTRHYKTSFGLSFRDRERFVLCISPEFPFRVPRLYFQHNRFIGEAHVQWGRYICLYQSVETEWNPTGGLFGFFDRVDQWLTAADSGQLDPEDAPLHPPVAYTGSDTKIVIKADTPRIPTESSVWLGRADLLKVRDDRFDLINWVEISSWDEIKPKGSDIGAAILLSQPLPMEFPSKVKDLIDVLETVGLSFDFTYRLLRLLAIMSAPGFPACIILGAPMRRKAVGEDRKQHLTVWEVAADALENLRQLVRKKDDEGKALGAVAEWICDASVQWCTVLEDRPEIVHRRDIGSLGAALSGKRVVLYGCGALGSAIAENAVRAGVRSLALVDDGIVKPGILVRQRFSDLDIGRAKVLALKDRLESIGMPCMVTHHQINLKNKALDEFDLSEWDLIIDATASASVSHKMEMEIAEGGLGIPLIAVSVSAAAHHGSVAVRMPGYTGGPMQISRQAKLEAFLRDAREPLVRAFWPKREEIKVFQPEPGCSEPTFTGSALDLDHHASGLLNLGLSRINGLDGHRASLDLVAAPWLGQKVRGRQLLKYDFEPYKVYAEQNHAFDVLQSQMATQDILTEIARISRTQSSKIETGGLMFGEIDDGHRHIWIDSASGPPPDSEASAEKFLCGTAGTVELAKFKHQVSGGSSTFVGIWHTHPISRGRPSDDDLFAMAQLLLLQQSPPRQVVMLIVGFSETKKEFNYYLYHRKDFKLISVSANESRS